MRIKLYVMLKQIHIFTLRIAARMVTICWFVLWRMVRAIVIIVAVAFPRETGLLIAGSAIVVYAADVVA